MTYLLSFKEKKLKYIFLSIASRILLQANLYSYRPIKSIFE